jgi:hypothetical protein
MRANAASTSVRKRLPNPSTRSSYHAEASAISAEATRRISATASRQSSASFAERFGRRDRFGGSRPKSRYSRSNFFGPKILGIGIVLLIETLGEPQNQSGTLVRRKGKCFGGNGFC